MLSSETFDVWIQTNSPGELSSWVRSFCHQISLTIPQAKIHIFLTPCQYASGNEVPVAKTFENVVEVFSPKETIRLLASAPFFSKKNKNGFVLYLGGDPIYTRLMALKKGLFAFGYSEHKGFLGWGYERSFYKLEFGDLMADAFLNAAEYVIKSEPPLLLFFAGSRPLHFKHLAPFLDEVTGYLKPLLPHWSFSLLPSPFIDTKLKESVRKKFKHLNYVEGSSQDLLKKASCLVTLPGTNTAEAGYLGVPMVVLVPLNNPELIIFDGILGLIGKLPFLGTGLKRLVIEFMKLNKNRLFALPNLLLKQKIVPEIIGHLEAKSLAETLAIYCKKETLDQIRVSLKPLKPKDSVSKKMLKMILSDLGR